MHYVKGGLTMSKKIGCLTLCLTLVLVFSHYYQRSFAASIETEGDLKVNGWIESTSGGFKFPDGSLLEAAGLNGFLFNVGLVVDDSNSNAGNVGQGAIKFGTGGAEGIASQRIGSGNLNGLDLYTNSTARLSITNNGYVGIGTRAPAFPLDARKARGATYARFGSDGARPLFLMASSPNVGFNSYYDGGYKYGAAGYAGYLAFGSSGDFIFATAPSGSADTSATMTNRMVIANNGRVGIGTGAPTAKLDVQGGDVKVSGNVIAGPGQTHTPLAYGVFSSDGTKTSGSSNISCEPNPSGSSCVCTITGEVFTFNNYVANVTPISFSAVIPSVIASDGKLVVIFFDLSGETVQSTFNLTVFKL
jgi:hypothetical protein